MANVKNISAGNIFRQGQVQVQVQVQVPLGGYILTELEKISKKVNSDFHEKEVRKVDKYIYLKQKVSASQLSNKTEPQWNTHGIRKL